MTAAMTDLATPIVLHGFGAGFGLPEISPYVCKTEVQLMMLGLPYEKVRGDRAKAPKSKLPYIEDAGTVVADSSFIRWHLERSRGLDLDAGLDARQRAEAWAFERLAEDHLGWTLTFARWLTPDNFAKGPAHFFDAAPDAVRDGLRQDALERVTAAHYAQGMGRHSAEEICALATRSLDALAARIGDGPWLMGKTPCGADATLFAMLAGLMTPFFDSPIRRRAEGFANLAGYVRRGMARWYPGFAW